MSGTLTSDSVAVAAPRMYCIIPLDGHFISVLFCLVMQRFQNIPVDC